MRSLRREGRWLPVCAALALACGQPNEDVDPSRARVIDRPAPGRDATPAEELTRPELRDVAARAPSAPADAAKAERLGAVLALAPEGADLDELIRALRFDTDPEVRAVAAVALAYTDDPRSVDALIAATADADPGVVVAAIETLAWSEDRQARATLESLAGSEEPRIAAAAARALTEP